ncbi:MAG TPA: pyridoxamine 5'-phosphate oxidase family protein [Solirubrobacteraceae bacterium]|nr:pyridoxamine 5'-phosphate oxidase family protein [Solirubrobacteraceae bacterium]
MHETEDDLRALQDLLDRSHANAGPHLRSLFTDDSRIPAAELPELLRGVQVLALATVTARGEPRVAPVDGLFFRGRWHFGSAHNSARFRHIRARPAVSAAHVRGEQLAVVVHGTAHELNPRAPEHAAFRAYLNQTYPGWDDAGWTAGAPYARIEPAAMFTFRSGVG